MAKIRFTGSRLTSTALSSVAGTVVMKMAANSHFPNLAAKVATLSAARTALNAADSNYEAAKATFTEKVNIRRPAIDVMRAAHVSLIGAIESDAMGDPVKLSSFGYELASDPVPTTQPPAMIANLVATTDDGELDLTWEAEPDALSYEVQLTETVDVVAPKGGSRVKNG